jgi:hypothetical protein
MRREKEITFTSTATLRVIGLKRVSLVVVRHYLINVIQNKPFLWRFVCLCFLVGNNIWSFLSNLTYSLSLSFTHTHTHTHTHILKYHWFDPSNVDDHIIRTRIGRTATRWGSLTDASFAFRSSNYLPFWLIVFDDTGVCRVGTTGGSGALRCLDKTCAGFDITSISTVDCMRSITSLLCYLPHTFSLFLSPLLSLIHFLSRSHLSFACRQHSLESIKLHFLFSSSGPMHTQLRLLCTLCLQPPMRVDKHSHTGESLSLTILSSCPCFAVFH